MSTHTTPDYLIYATTNRKKQLFMECKPLRTVMKAIYTHRVVQLCALFVLLGSASLLVQAYYSETIVVRRSLPTTTPQQGYQCAVSAWKQNLGLWFLPPAFILNPGHAQTGVGLIVMRIPPMGLREGIVDYKEKPTENQLCLIYKVLNPSPFTWPVSEHVGEILFRPGDDEDSCELEWTVQWTPFAPWLPFFPQTLKAITLFIIEWAASFVVTLREKEINDGKDEL